MIPILLEYNYTYRDSHTGWFWRMLLVYNQSGKRSASLSCLRWHLLQVTSLKLRQKRTFEQIAQSS